MNYIQQVNGFYDMLSVNPLSSNVQCLYFALLHINNKCYWVKEFSTSNIVLMSLTSMTKKELYTARNILIQKKLINFKPGANKNKAGTYEIIELNSELDSRSDAETYEINRVCSDLDDTSGNTNGNSNGNTSGNTNGNTNGNSKVTNNKHKTINKNENKNKKEIKRKSFDDVFEEQKIPKDLKDALIDFIEMRKAIKKPLTSRALELAINKLRSLNNDLDNQIQIVNQSVENSWQGFYPLKNKTIKNSDKIIDEIWEENHGKERVEINY